MMRWVWATVVSAVALGVTCCGGSDDEALTGDGADAGSGAAGASAPGGSGGAAGDGSGGSTPNGAGAGGGPATGGAGGGVPSGGTGGGGGAPSGGSGGGSGSGGSAGSSTGGAPALSPCDNSLDCVGDPFGRLICAAGIGVCVECGATADCPTDFECLGNRCIAFEPCSNSLDCTPGSVCDATRGRCVDCAGNNDCDPEEICVASACVTACDSDNDCTSSGRLCDFSTGACAECLVDGDCDAADFCLGGACVLDVCPAGESVCSLGAISACNARGDALLPAVPCGARQTCVDGTSGASCEPWVCTAGVTECATATTVATCAADGLSVESTIDCTTTGEVCNAGACSNLACSPGLDFCDQGTVRRCASDGLSSTLIDTCESSEFCDDTDPSCKPLLCTPGAPACNGDVATTCNATGTGYEAGGTNCTTAGQTCVAGSCQSCPGGAGPLADVRLVEVFVGQSDYVILRNTNPTCAVDLSGLTLTVGDTDASGISLTISSHVLDPGTEVLVAESGATGPVTSGLIDLNFTAGHVMLCAGVCATGASPTVIDAMSYWDGATSPPAFPSPVTFSPIQGIDSTNGATTAFVRTAFTGAYPSYAAADWSTAPATQPDAPAGTCPSTQPSGICTSFGLSCTYGPVTCTCPLTIIWTCL